MRRQRLDEAAWGQLSERLGRLLDAGVPLLEALQFLADRGNANAKERASLLEIMEQLRSGRLLSQTLRAREAPLLLQALVEVGEQNGDLAGSLFRAAAHCTERVRWRRERRQAMSYPLLVVSVLLLLCLFLFQIVIPRFSALYEGMGLPVSGATRWLFAAAEHAPLGLALLVLSFFLTFRKRPFLHRLPLLKDWHLLDRTHEWAATLGLLLDGGLSLLHALHLQSQLPLQAENRHIGSRVRERILRGSSLGEALAQEELEPTLALSVRVAELTGDLSHAFLTVERELAERRKEAMTRLLKLLEPLLLLLAGSLVGVVALLMLWPMLDLLQTIS